MFPEPIVSQNELNRYFIELQPAGGPPVPRAKETEQRRRQAEHFIASIADWLRNHAMEDRVTALTVTALGQVQITCPADVINHIRDENDQDIANIRPGAVFTGNLGRW